MADLSAMLEIALRRGNQVQIDRARPARPAPLPDREGESDQLLQLGEWEIGQES